MDDHAFARAYEDVGDLGRAWIKRALADLYAWHGPPLAGTREVLERPGDGSLRRRQSRPLDFALVFVDPAATSPAKLLAALMPALVAGTGRVAVLGREGRLWADPLLCALELAGLEDVFTPDKDAVRDILDQAASRAAAGAVLALDPAFSLEALRSPDKDGAGPRFWSPPFGRRAAVYAPRPDVFDWAALDFAHPDTAFTVFGKAPEGLPERFALRPEAEVSAMSGFRAVFALPEDLDRLPLDADLVLGPGMESCWAWPGLGPDFFTRTRLVWAGEP